MKHDLKAGILLEQSPSSNGIHKDRNRDDHTDPAQTNLFMLNHGVTNVNNAIASKVYAHGGGKRDFSFEESEFVVVSANNRLFERSGEGNIPTLTHRRQPRFRGQIGKEFCRPAGAYS